MPKFENWLHIIENDDTHVQCIYCDVEMSAKKSVLQKHAMSKKHIEKCNEAYCKQTGDMDSSDDDRLAINLI